MKTREKRFRVAGVLLTHVVLMVFVLGFTGCDMVKDFLGLNEEEPDPTPPPPESNAYLTVYVSDSVGPTNHYGTIEKALNAVADAY
jgi:hypothetical protein